MLEIGERLLERGKKVEAIASSFAGKCGLREMIVSSGNSSRDTLWAQLFS